MPNVNEGFVAQRHFFHRNECGARTKRPRMLENNQIIIFSHRLTITISSYHYLTFIFVLFPPALTITVSINSAQKVCLCSFSINPGVGSITPNIAQYCDPISPNSPLTALRSSK